MPAPRADRLHRRLFTLDSHLDTPTASFLRPAWNFGRRHDRHRDASQCDLPRMREGGLKAAVFAIFILQAARTPAGRRAARDTAFAILRRTRATLARHRRGCAIAETAADGPRIAATGRRAIYLSLENGHGLGPDLSALAEFRRLGLRLLGLTHLLNNDLGDASTDPRGPEWHGLSPLGREAVAECNRLGVVPDASHASDAVLAELLERSRTPVVLSHSGCKAVFDHPRNIDDALLRALARHGGVIQINSLSAYLVASPPDPAAEAALQKLMARFERLPLTLEVMAEADRAFHEFDHRFSAPKATLSHFLDHLVHAVEVAGIDHVGIGTDFDGGGGVAGLRDAADYPNITRELVRRGFTARDLGKIWGGNLLRILRVAEAAAA